MMKETLKTLLQRLNSERIIRESLSCPRHSKEGMLGEENFVFLYRHDNQTMTLDQIRCVEALLRTNWMKEKNSSNYKYSKRDSLYNVILRCAEETLCLDNDKPACRYDSVIEWHELSTQLGEDIFTTALTAAHDVKYHRNRNLFAWHPYVKTVHPALNELYEKPLTELHAHLKGTSLNFDINWLCLMNHIQNRAKEFDMFSMRQHAQVTVQMEDYVNDLYHQIMKAAAIRLYLFSYIHGHTKDVYDCVMTMLRSQNRLEATSCCMNLQGSIDSYRQMYGKRYHKRDNDYDILDYAIVNNTPINDENRLYSVLSGERQLLYSVLSLCYDGKLSNCQEGLLTAYLITKTRLRQEIVQLNKGVGFDNFAKYEERKTAFVKEGTVYEKLIAQLAIGNFLKVAPDKRYMEARIVPKEDAEGVHRQINKTDSDVHNPQFDQGIGWGYHYIYHFIKTADRTNKHIQELVPRHYALREKVRRQAKAIYNYRNLNIYENDRVVGVDAANSEILSRPEVFAQAFRYLRRHTICDTVLTRPNDMGMTYHVGEDFMDVADGLRAYDEVIKYMQFGEGDRLGHALVLGVDVKDYYKKRHYSIAMPIQMILDNTVWLYEECKVIGDPYLLIPQLEKDYENYFRMVYGSRIPVSSIHTYYHSWMLRGDNPFCYKVPSEKPELSVSVDEWEMSDIVVDDQDVDTARNDETARYLCSRYHFDKEVKKNGAKVEKIKVTEAYVKSLEIIRKRKLQDVEKRHIAIECNPTSNYKIGELSDYKEHPISIFYNEGIKRGGEKHGISVSINSDDAGVFATSIEREYAVMAKAMEEKWCNEDVASPKQVYSWLDDIRKFGLQQKFGR